MEWMDRERKFWLVGGDQRQQALAKLLEEEGNTVHITALEGEGLTPEPLGPGLTLAHCVILPLPVTQGEGLVHTPLSRERLPLKDLLAALTPGQILCGGLVTPAVRRAAEDHGLRVFDYYAREECMVANAVPNVAVMRPTIREGMLHRKRENDILQTKNIPGNSTGAVAGSMSKAIVWVDRLRYGLRCLKILCPIFCFYLSGKG